jgi:2-polyprenyl-6-methoxyphenol hydroxylase-like FAD-dependent oxidoreductase
MAVERSITIIGGGLAGLALGIGLRQCDLRVTIHEAGNYPRHRVCGEFISGRGQTTLARLGLGEMLARAGAVSARTAAFYSATKSSSPRALPSAAICLSRFALDAALADTFRRLGGELVGGKRDARDVGEGIVRATGRLKVHARNVALAADLEMHVSPRGYVGLCKINDGQVNVCGLFRKGANENAGTKSGRELLRGPAGSPLNQRLAAAVFEESSFCAVAGLSLQPQRAAARAEICVGDAITMIPPVTGNGMSMAFESAELAISPLAAWSQGEISWNEARQKIAFDCDTAFARRLAWAKWLQRIFLAPALQNPLVSFLARNDWFWRLAFERTR